MTPKTVRHLLALAAAIVLPTVVQAQTPAYHLAASSAPLGGPDLWDYVVFDAPSHRVYLAHADRVAVLDSRTAAVVGQVEGIPGGTHGIGISHATGLGFTDDGRAGEAVAFDLKTLKVVKKLKVDEDADAIAFDKASGHVFIMEGDPAKVQVIDPKTDAVITAIPTGSKLEYAVADGHGHLFVNGASKREVIRIDTRTNTVDAHWPIPACASPHGLAMDVAHHRLFAGCINSSMTVVNSDTGAVVATLPIGRGSDAIGFDAKRNRVFSANGIDGTLSVFQETSPDAYALLATVATQLSGRTMDVDPATGRVFIAAADFAPAATPAGRPTLKPGTLRLLMFDPAP